MSFPPAPTLESVIAKIPPRQRVPLNKLRATGRMFSQAQVGFMRACGALLSAPELELLFGRPAQGIRVMAARLDITLMAVEQVKKPESAKPPTRAPLDAGGRALLNRGSGIGSNLGSVAAHKRVASAGAHQMPESLRNYRPVQADLEAGWVVNNYALNRMGLKKLGPEGCSWILGDPHEPGWHFCGKTRVRGKVYCGGHLPAAFQRVKETEDGGESKTDGVAGAGVDDTGGVRQNPGGAERPLRRAG